MNALPVLSFCRHCGAPLPAGSVGPFCGEGCAKAFGLIEEAGLTSFYDHLIRDPSMRPLRPEEHPVRDLSLNVKAGEEGTASLDLMVDGLHCAACCWLIEIMLTRCAEVITARINYSTRRLHLAWRGAPEKAAKFVGLAEALGFRLTPFDPARLDSYLNKETRELLRCLAVAGFAAANVMLLSVSVWAGHATGMGQATRDLMHWLSALIGLPAILYAGRPFFRSAWLAVRHGRSNMDLPISIGVIAAAGMSLSETVRHGPYAYFDSAVTLLFFLLIGRVLDLRARGRTREAAAHLLSLGVTGATRLADDGRAETVALSALRRGDRILVATGERIGADGTVATGRSDLDASLLTGESLPLAIEPGSAVFAGQINLSAPLTVTVGAAGDDTLLAEIVRLMEAAESGQARYRRLADRLVPIYAPVVHVAALGTYLFWWAVAGQIWQIALLRAVSVLIITCPCALGLAIPAVQVAASGRLFRRGILLKSATALERLADADRVVFDKTGTLTLGKPELKNDPDRDEDVLRLAAGIARASRHPLARALSAVRPDEPVRPGVEEIPGCGLMAGDVRLGSRIWVGLSDDASIDPELWLSLPGLPRVRFAFEETLRPDAVETVTWLSHAGYSVSLLSGDRPSAVAAMAKRCGIEDWQGGVDPATKVRWVSAAKALGERVLMVGDGLNDAPALAAAHVSMSPASAADVTQTTADIIFQGESLSAVAEALSVAKKARSVIRQNLAFAVLYNLAAVPLAVAGWVTPPLAAALMSSSSLIVVLNALRLSGRRPLREKTN